MGAQSYVARRGVLAAAALAAAAMVGVGATSVSAADRSVDPSTLTPPPPDFFNAVCREAGQQILCDLAFVDPVSPVEEPTGIVCGTGADSFEILDTWTRSVQGIRYYSSDGLLLRRHFNDEWQGTFTNSVTGATAPYYKRNTYLHDLAVPGDAESGIERDTVHWRLETPGRTLLLETGRVVRVRADDSVLFMAGKHVFDDYFGGDTSALQPLCDALAP